MADHNDEGDSECKYGAYGGMFQQCGDISGAQKMFMHYGKNNDDETQKDKEYDKRFDVV
jgi:hypothetical protein